MNLFKKNGPGDGWKNFVPMPGENYVKKEEKIHSWPAHVSDE